VLLAGQRKKQAHMPHELAESVAAELALAMQLEEERRLGHDRQRDFQRVIAALTGSESPAAILSSIVKDATQKPEHGPESNVVFAAIGRFVEPPKAGQDSAQPVAQIMRFTWHSGAGAWIRSLETGELTVIWRRAIETHGLIGTNLGLGPSDREVARIVAWPLEAAGQALGAFVAGVRKGTTSLGTLERLECSAALASSVLLQLKRAEQATEWALRHPEALAPVETPSRSIPTAHSDAGLTEISNVIEWLEEGIVLFDADEKVRAVNTRFGQIAGLAPDELAAIKSVGDLAAVLSARSADVGNFAERWRRSNPNPQSAVREELHLVRPVARLLERVARPFLDDHGGLIGRVEIYRDLTAQRVFQSKLMQTEKLAELGQMVTGIAHELSNPLTSILGYAQRLLLHRDAAGDSYEARQILQEAERASAILRQLLLSARDSRPERRRVALNQVISRTLELQHFNATSKAVHVQLDLDPVLPFVQGDAGQLQQVLMNLLANARHAIEEQGKGGTIRVRTARLAEKRVLLEVSDDGPGIPQAIRARIFDPFFTTKPAGVGTGLGLGIVLDIVREHGGKLHLTSGLGQGTTFSIELPAATATDMPLPATGGNRPAHSRIPPLAAPEPLETVHAGVTLGPWAGTRVLVLEDEPTVARLIADVLQDEGLRVDVLLDAHEALHRAAHRQYALAICDMKMPELDGEHFYQALVRAKNPLRDRFLFVTGDVLAAHTRNFLQRNNLPHVAKPFRVEELTEKIRTLLEATSPREPARVPAGKRNAARK
jgi:signal transduction histidine kinase/ActR/RegA family two-component response regulator